MIFLILTEAAILLLTFWVEHQKCFDREIDDITKTTSHESKLLCTKGT
jgi:hypothetical protein